MNNNNELMCEALMAQVYTRLVMAALHRTTVTSSDIAHILLGYRPTSLRKEQAQMINDIVCACFEFDARNKRKPLSALFVKAKQQQPGPKFAELCLKHELITKDVVQDESKFNAWWRELTQDIYAAYNLNGGTLCALLDPSPNRNASC